MSQTRRSSSRKRAPKQKNVVRFMPNPGVREVNYTRDIPSGHQVSQQVRDQLDALSIVHTGQRKELDALRRTRGQRQVTPLKTPAHLQRAVPITDEGVRKLGDINGKVLPAEN